MANTFEKCVAYYRLPTAWQKRLGLNLEAQREAVTSLLYEGGQDLIEQFVEVEGSNGTDRAELMKALDLAEINNATLIVAKLGRLSRDAKFLHLLLKYRVPIVFADMPCASRRAIELMATLASWEREQNTKATKAALVLAKARGQILGGDRGNLAAARAKRTSAAKERAAKVWPHIQQARAEGHASLQALAEYLNAKGIRTTKGGKWQAWQVRRVLASNEPLDSKASEEPRTPG